MQVPTVEQQQQQRQLQLQIEALEKELSSWDEQLSQLQTNWEQSIARQGESSQPVVDSGWYKIGPLTEPTAQQVLATDYLTPPFEFDADTPVKMQGTDKQWTAFPGLIDGNAHSFPWERSANYLVRTIKLDGPQKATVSIGCTDALKFWLNGKLLVDRYEPLPIAERQHEFEVELQAGENQLLAKAVNISWECEFSFSLRSEARAIPDSIRKIAETATDERSDADAKLLRNFYRENLAEIQEFQAQRSALFQRKRQLAALDTVIPTTMVMREMGEPRKTFRLDRGQYDSPKEEVSPTTPAVLPSLSTAGSVDRLALAQWLIDPSHPLTARVAVNRLWQMLFGVGLVATSEDFGTQGEWPSHPELLDWLAVEFVESGWDVKHMLRLMVLSETYRQSSAATPQKLERDPNNRLLSRGPRFRLQAELVRDLALKASGLLNEQIGGPSSKHYQPPGLWLELAHQKDNSKFTAQEFEQSSGKALYRRGMYTFWKRSVPPPNLVTFDAPNRETCVVRRETTNTPLQALVLLNDPTFVEASRALAQRVIQEATAESERASRAFLLATAREPDEKELAILLNKYQWHLAEYRENPTAADRLLSVGESSRDPSIDAAEHAAWTTVASLILNLDETITKE